MVESPFPQRRPRSQNRLVIGSPGLLIAAIDSATSIEQTRDDSMETLDSCKSLDAAFVDAERYGTLANRVNRPIGPGRVLGGVLPSGPGHRFAM